MLVRTSQRRTCLSQLEVTITLPSGENVDDVTQLLCARRDVRNLQVGASQIFAEPSFEAVVNLVPSSEKKIELTEEECGVNMMRSDLTDNSVRRILPDVSPENIFCVCGVTATHVRDCLPPLKSVRRYFDVS